ncbi:vancomycin resistance protein [Acinetobacter sp. Ac_3412]|uniref:VanW family protein n=1 Tax=Acinetobacter sp. Ac_3412 TaxID=1848935 RepID=UPI00149059B9|nr:VanW family protein [Acinetobacter sp. Ac_3412]NNP77357.1 vancomycin resistance protein [Acinetobacter sp. Ac_3412]
MQFIRLLFKKPVSQYHPALYFIMIWIRRGLRYVQWKTDRRQYAQSFDPTPLTFRVKKHQSVLIRKLGDTEQHWQKNKVINLKIASEKISTILIKPQETFSFCQLVGLPTIKQGYVEGMELSFGQARGGIGGGICQIANLIHWLVLHSPLQVIQRSQHSFDPFPDQGRILPFGSGAAIFYNYIDYQFYNPTEYTFQINLWFSSKCLEGELRCSHDLGYIYHVFEQKHRFIQIGANFYRQNEIWRHKKEKYKSGEIIATECVTKNFAKVMYEPAHIDAQFASIEEMN